MDIKNKSRQQLSFISKSAANYAAILKGEESPYPGTEIVPELKGMNSDALISLAEKAKEKAEFLKKIEPPYELALIHGVSDNSYDTQSNGWIYSFSGETGNIVLENGQIWKAVGHSSYGDAWYGYSGHIEWFPVNF